MVGDSLCERNFVAGRTLQSEPLKNEYRIIGKRGGISLTKDQEQAWVGGGGGESGPKTYTTICANDSNGREAMRRD